MEYHFTTVDGKPCSIPVPPRDLSDLERFHHDCGCACATCAERESIMNTDQIVIGPRDTLRFSHGSATGAELRLLAERQEADRVARRFVEDGLGTYAQGLAKYLELHPGARARLAGVAQSPEDLLRKQGADQGYVVETEAGVRYHVSGAPPKGEDAPDPEGEEVVTIVERGVARYIVHGAIAPQDYQKTPGLGQPKTAEEARKRLRALVGAKRRQGVEDMVLDVLGTSEGKALLDLILEGEE